MGLAIHRTLKLPEVLKETAKEPKIEQVKAVAKLYLPVAAVGTITLAALSGSNSVAMKQRSAMAGALGLMRDREPKDPKERPTPNLGVMPPKSVIPGDGDILYYENYTGRWFMSDSEKIRDVERRLNNAYSENGYVCLNELYKMLGLKQTDFGEEVGWSSFDPHGDDYICLAETVALTADGVSCMILDFYQLPYFCYMNF